LAISHKNKEGIKYAERVLKQFDDKYVDYKKILKISKRNAKYPLPTDVFKKLEFIPQKSASPELINMGQAAFKASPGDIRNIVFTLWGNVN
jgi:hypothetical protein